MENINTAFFAEQIRQAVNDLEPEMVAFAQGLFQIPTQNPPGNNYRECATYIGHFMEQLGMHVEYVQVPGDRLLELAPLGEGLPRINVIGTWKGMSPRPNIHFTGHYDVVPEGVGWTLDPYGAQLKDGKLYARGASDQKSGIVSELFALYALQKAGIRLKGTYIASATPDEETGGQAGVGYLVEQGYISRENTDYCVVTECLDKDKVCIGHRGTLWFEIQLLGKQCHGSMPSEGVNAIDHMQRLLTAMDETIRTLPELSTVSPLPVQPPACRQSTLTTTYILAGEKVNTVPGSCRVGFDWRLTPEYSVDWARDQIISLCERLKGTVDGFDYVFHEIMSTSPSLVPRDTRVVSAFLESGREILGRDMEFSVSPGEDDQKYMVNGCGMDQCIVYGPGPLTLAHKADEYVTVQDLKESAEIMALAAVKLLGTV